MNRFRRRLTWVFFGPVGLRAGWGILLFATIFFKVTAWVTIPLASLLDRTRPLAHFPWGADLMREGILFLRVFVSTALMALIERRALFAFYLQDAAALRRLFSGLLVGFVSLSLLVVTLWVCGFMRVEAASTDPRILLQNALGWGAVFLLVALFEELLLRGYAQFKLTRTLGFWWGAVVLSLLFGALHIHNGDETPVGIAQGVAVAMLLCLSVRLTGSLWWAIGFHAAWDWAQSFVYGTADSGSSAQGSLFVSHPLGNALLSGGNVGPEGSVFALVVCALTAWAIGFKRRRMPLANSASM